MPGPIKSNPTDGSIINSPESDNSRKIFVGGLSQETNTNKLREFMSQFGEVEDVDIKTVPETKCSRGFGFVLFKEASSIDAVEADKNMQLDGKKIGMKRAEKRPSKIFVGGLKPDFDDDQIKAIFEEYGTIELFERKSDRNTGKKQAFCFITFESDAVALKLVKQRWHEVLDKRCEIKQAFDKDKRGGYGGGYGGFGGGYGWDDGYYGGFGGGYDDGFGYGGGFGGPGFGGPGFGGFGGGFAPRGRGRGGGPMRGGRGGRGRPGPY